ncbi:hypothetical protein VNO77_07891 [Canavalia gladiata]|uniref:Uncharacterized protein n=1 Tax=Canavalia gladiata TaxID=3824 RepID=A0AAN9MDJ3_CANGL
MAQRSSLPLPLHLHSLWKLLVPMPASNRPAHAVMQGSRPPDQGPGFWQKGKLQLAIRGQIVSDLKSYILAKSKAELTSSILLRLPVFLIYSSVLNPLLTGKTEDHEPLWKSVVGSNVTGPFDYCGSLFNTWSMDLRQLTLISSAFPSKCVKTWRFGDVGGDNNFWVIYGFDFRLHPFLSTPESCLLLSVRDLEMLCRQRSELSFDLETLLREQSVGENSFRGECRKLSLLLLSYYDSGVFMIVVQSQGQFPALMTQTDKAACLLWPS